MIKVKTFATPIKIFATIRELTELDETVGKFLADEKATTVYSVSDSTTAGDTARPSASSGWSPTTPEG